MKIDKSRVVSYFNKCNSLLMRRGWFGDHPKSIEDKVEGGTYILQLQKFNSRSKDLHFIDEFGNPWRYFLPAPYELEQKVWVKENNIEVGDWVYIKHGWSKGERGFNEKYACDLSICESYIVRNIHEDGVVVGILKDKDNYIRNTDEYFVPYFVIKKMSVGEFFKEWKRRTKLKVKDRVRIVRSWENNPSLPVYVTHYLDEEGEVLTVTGTLVEVQLRLGIAIVPYFAIDKVSKQEEETTPFINELFVGAVKEIKTYGGDPVKVPLSPQMENPCKTLFKQIEKGVRQFENATEFKSHKNRWLFDGEDYGKVVHFNDEGCTIMWGEDADFTYYGELISKEIRFEDTNEIAGVKEC